MTRRFSHLIGGQAVDSPASFFSRSSSNLEDVLGEFPEASQAQVRDACVAARQAFAAWGRTPAPIRGQIIGSIGKAIEREKEALSRLVSREMGKTLKEARGDVQEAIDTCHFFQSEGRRLYGQTVPSEMQRKELQTYRRPLGVVAIITAGNFPIAVPSWKIIPALVTGNTIVWKPSEDCPASSYAFAKLIEEAGLPAGVLNVVFGGGKDSAGQHLVDLMDERDERGRKRVDKFAFTGSTAVGRQIGAIAGRNLLHPTLELGGKNPLIVMADADLDNAVSGALWAAFGTGGQRCTSAGNIILDAPIYDEFKRRFLAAAQAITIGDPIKHPEVLYGPFINERFYHSWAEHYSWGRADGATLLYGQGRITSENKPAGFQGDPSTGFFGWPTIWEGVRPGMQLFQREIFGPTINLVRVSGIDEAIDTANSVDYGLSSACYTNNREWAYQFKERIEAGMSSINNSTTGAEAHMPFGGVKGSGNGTRESGIWVIESYTYWHAVNDDISGKLQLAQMDTGYIEPKAPFSVAEIDGV
ncbi:MAG TPA: aldehyde dehydrogenase family protein [Kouleothrix sp.]|uniref:aldehyde dehydrogenase family protein n=1 Tax=Kouleothrix sp. TaxID=2779161 RepID=UPI002CAFCEA5|nr:aldehyde dehydrogenase family protein [Kouleothrix sp.]HRC76994.1 aldehyde dehydrogenase family protein [Kouleothrix sp.]